MSEEVKEILEALKRCDNTYLKIENSNGEKEYEYHQVNDLRLDGYHSQLLLDYITNLQTKYENQIHRYMNLKEYTTNLQEKNERLNTELNAYKSRCEKANEYIKSFYETPEDIDAYDITYYWADKVMGILNGGDE